MTGLQVLYHGGPSVPAWLLAGPRAAQGSVGGGKPVCGWGGLGDVAVPGDGDTEALGHADGSEALVRGSDPDSMCIPPPSPDASPTVSARLQGFPWSRMGPRRGVGGLGRTPGGPGTQARLEAAWDDRGVWSCEQLWPALAPSWYLIRAL